ncbi:hypothetical protein [Mastigocladopsis repens]|uniref:hypothetical protein n=1 Tax=Mastigocladopsis repens TaxID=221287 RepID=UPI00030077FB|nr:hypothetical protein [Mastigocladopsis repens]
MNLQEFESQYRNNMDEALNELQTAILLLAQVQNTISLLGSYVQSLSQTVEEYINTQNLE